MNILLFNINRKFASDGARLIAALLKRAGHTVKTIYITKDPHPRHEDRLELIDPLIAAADLVMVAVYSSQVGWAIRITSHVHQRFPRKLVIWGGPHCISAPEISLQHADGVCFAEGDVAVVELVARVAEGKDYLSTPNMAFRVEGQTIRNSLLPLTNDLDTLPFPDYELKDQYLLSQELLTMNPSLLKDNYFTYAFETPTYVILTAQGCPHTCSYCNNCRYVSMYGVNRIRFRSVANFLGEIEQVLGRFPFLRRVFFCDDDFLVRPKTQLQEFAEEYQKRIGLPFGLTMSANTYRREKLDILLSAGLAIVQMGIQSGSQRVIDEVYDRKIPVAKAKAVAAELDGLPKAPPLTVDLDFIIDNPYETRDDIALTGLLLIDLPLRARINIFPLAFFPGTPIYERALKDGFIGPFDPGDIRFQRFHGRTSVMVYQNNYETLMLLIVVFLRRKIGRFVRLIRGLLSPPVRRLFALLPTSFFAFAIRIRAIRPPER